MTLEKTDQCENTMPHDAHDEWIPNPLWPVDEKAEPTLLHCPGVVVANPDAPLSDEIAQVSEDDIPVFVIGEGTVDFDNPR